MAPKVLSLNSAAESFDILNEFNRVFWKGMDRASALEAINKLGVMYRVVPSTGLDYGMKVA